MTFEATSEKSLEGLVNWFKRFDSCIVAFSAGVDSSLLALAARDALGKRAYAVTSLSASFSNAERTGTRAIASEIGIELIEVEQDDLGNKDYVKNNVNRCYFCRNNLSLVIAPVSQKLGVEICVDGTHIDDMHSPRPGIKALREAGFRAPLVELGFTKDEVRAVARISGLSNWNRPSEACLSSRIAYGQKIDADTLLMIEKAELEVKRITGASIIRVRTIGKKGVVELDHASVPLGLERRNEIESHLKQLGYEKVEIDKEGYVSGKMLQLFVKSDL